MNVFLSYSRRDSEFARKLSADLKSLGIRTWLDAADLAPGQNWPDEIRRAIGRADYMLFLLSSGSFSEWMMKEIEVALAHNIAVVPVIVDEVAKHRIPPKLAEIQWLDLSDPREYEAKLRYFALGAATSEAVSSERTTPAPSEKFARLDIDELVNRIAFEVATRISSPSNETITHRTSRQRGMEAKSVFVIMAFTDDMEPVFEGIRDAAKAAGLEAMRVKDFVGDYQISNKLITMIQESTMVVADLTHERPNVYFELGYARGIGKTVITTARDGTPLHFDIRDWTCTFYSDSRILERRLKERFEIELQSMQQSG